MAFMFNQGDRPLDGYTIQRGVGRGGFGEVYHALSDGGKEVALKFLRENPQIELRGVQHCLNLKSPHLVTLYDVKQNANEDWFVIMEYVAGPSLRDLMLDSPKGLGPQKAAFFLREMCKGLTYLHDRGIVHRDMKPGNLFYDEGYVKIGDYGLSKVMSPSQHSGQTMSVGTVHYMAPEVGSGNYSRTIDIYAVGVILYEMLLGRVPYQGATMGEVLMKHLTAQPEVDELVAPFPQVIRKALAKDPKDRYQTVTEMVNEVFSSSDLQASLNAFEPASLSAVAARVAKQSIEAMTPRPMGSGSSNVGRFAAETMAAPRADARATPGGRGPAAFGPMPHGAPIAPKSLDPKPVMNRKGGERLGLALMLTTGVSLAAAWVSGNGRLSAVLVPVSFVYIAAMVGGSLLGTYISFHRLRQIGYWPHRFINAGCGIAVIGALMLATFFLWLPAGSRTPAPTVVTGATVGPGVAPGVGTESEVQVDDEGNSTVTVERDAASEYLRELKLQRETTPLQNSRAMREAQRQRERAINAVGGRGSSRSASAYSGLRNPPQPLNWAGPLMLLLLLGDWSGRVFRGRGGHVDFKWAISAAIFGYVAGMFFEAGGDSGTIAILAAAASIAVQLVASLWPLRDRELIPQTSRNRPATIHRVVGPDGRWLSDPRDERGNENTVVDSDHVGVERAAAQPAGRIAPPVMTPGRFGDMRGDAAMRGVEPLAPLRPDAARNRMSRALWLMVGLTAFGASAVMFIAYGLDQFDPGESSAMACAFATALALFGAFGTTRAIGGVRRGAWRGVIRPFVFTTGLACAAFAAVMVGHMDNLKVSRNHPLADISRGQREEVIIAIVFIIAGALMSLFVWFVPVGQYVPLGGIPLPTPTTESNRLRRRSRNFLLAGFGMIGVMGMTGAIIDNSLHGRHEDLAISVTMIPMSMLMVGFFVASGISRKQAGGPRLFRTEKLKLPLQRSFFIARLSDLDDLVTRHFMMLGYRPANRSRLLWSFERGSWAQMWHNDVRKHRTTVNVAAYEVPEGYRVTCVCDVDNLWNTPGQKQLTVLADEMVGLEELLTGQRIAAMV